MKWCAETKIANGNKMCVWVFKFLLLWKLSHIYMLATDKLFVFHTYKSSKHFFFNKASTLVLSNSYDS